MKKEIILETEMNCIYSGPTSVEIPDYKCKTFSKRYSLWYAISEDTIKGFDGEKWSYEKI